jgi:MtN3 and saliva related transmembrane protein
MAGIESSMAVAIGTVAGTLTTASFLPQVITVYRRKSARDLSFAYLLVFAIGVACWFIYGLLIRSVPVVITNVVTLTLVIAIMAMKTQFDRKN